MTYAQPYEAPGRWFRFSRSTSPRRMRSLLWRRRDLGAELQVEVVRRPRVEALVRRGVDVFLGIGRRCDRTRVHLCYEPTLTQLGVDHVGIERRDAERDVIHARAPHGRHLECRRQRVPTSDE